MTKNSQKPHPYFLETQKWMKEKRRERPDFDTVIRPKLGELAHNISAPHDLWNKPCRVILEHLYSLVTK